VRVSQKGRRKGEEYCTWRRYQDKVCKKVASFGWMVRRQGKIGDRARCGFGRFVLPMYAREAKDE